MYGEAMLGQTREGVTDSVVHRSVTDSYTAVQRSRVTEIDTVHLPRGRDRQVDVSVKRDVE